MARKTTRTRKKPAQSFNSNELAAEIVEADFVEILPELMKEYGTYIIEQRALPDLHDGLKPVHRRILWAMHAMGAHSKGNTIKTARVSGEVIGKYHPHGSAAVDEAINGLIEGAYTPLLIGQGNFGSYTKTAPAAAARYTECKLRPDIERLMLDPYYLKVVPKVPNYDGAYEEPVYLPALLPMVLATGAYGIAMGTTTKMPAFTLSSLREVVLHMIQNKGKVDVKKAAEMLEFATPYGGKVISRKNAVVTMLTENAGSIDWSCDLRFPSDTRCEIFGFHPDWNYDTKSKFLLDKIAGVTAVTDLSKGNDINLTVEVKRGADGERAMEQVEKACVGSITYNCNVTIRSKTKDDVPEAKVKFWSTNPIDVLEAWYVWRVKLEQAALKVELREVEAQILREDLLLLACQNLDIIFALLKKKGADKVAELAKKLKISEEDAKYIWGIAVGRLDRLSEEEQLRKLEELENRADQIEKDIKSPYKRIANGLKQLELID